MTNIPFDLDAERAVVGAALIDNTLFVSLPLDPSCFHMRSLRALWEEGRELASQGRAVDQITLSDKTLKLLGGAAEVMNLVNTSPSMAAVRAEDYADKLRGLAEQRRMLTAADWLGRAAYEEKTGKRRSMAAKARRRLQEIEADWNVSNGKAPLEVLSADLILTTEWPEPVWVVPDLLPAGLTILAGKPKLGKSWMALQLAQAVAAGGRFLNRRVEKGAVLYLALEDPPARLKDRMQRQGWGLGLAVDFLSLGDFLDRVGDLRNGGGDRVAAQIALRGYRFVVIDTLARAISGEQDSVDSMTEALTPVQEMAHECNCSVLITDHHKKGFGTNPDAIADILGSTAKGAVADTIWGLYRERGKPGAQLVVVGRETEEQELTLKIDWPTGCWHCDEQEMNISPAKQELLKVLEDLGPIGIQELSKAVDRNKGSVYRDLQDLVDARLVQKTRSGRGAAYGVSHQLEMFDDGEEGEEAG